MDGNFSQEKSVPSVNLSIEALTESKIQEITLDGRESYYRPLTMSENLCKLATKIDFLAEEEGRSDEEEDDEDSKKQLFQNQQWPWEGIRNHLRQSLTEMNVMIDVLTVTQNKGPPMKEGVPPSENRKYMMFDHAPKEFPPLKLPLQIPAKKKGLNAAAEILLSGEKRLKTAGEEALRDMNFHFQLLKLRKYWRVRKVGTKVLGDLSYRTAGSDFWHSGNFEVLKKTLDDCEEQQPPNPYSNSNARIFKNKIAYPFEVEVGADLKGSATLRFSICRKNLKAFGSDNQVSPQSSFSVNEPLTNYNDPAWHKTLCAAQHVLYCRELFNCLAKEAVQLRTSCTLTPFLVVGNKIIASIFTDTELHIEFLYNSIEQNKNQTVSSDDLNEDIYSLKYAAMKLLQKQHHSHLHIPPPHPSSATLGLTDVQRKASTRSYILSQLQTMAKADEVVLIEKLVNMAKHWELKRRVCKVIDSIEHSIQDPYFQAHWSVVGNTTETSVRIVISSAGYEACNRTLVEMFVYTTSIKVVQKAGRSVMLSSSMHHIKDYLLSLICSHQLSTIQEVSVILGWTVRHFSLHAGVSPMPPLGNVGSVMVVSPSGSNSISVRCWLEYETSSHSTQVKYEVYAQGPRMESDDTAIITPRSHLNTDQNIIKDPKWSLLGGEWREIDWCKLFGKHFIQKFESLLVFLKSDR